MESAGRRWSCSGYSVAAADGLVRGLGVSPVVAQVLARRGYGTVDAARSFLAAREHHDPASIGGIDDACRLILDHVARGSRIVVHGDYDVDGVASTTIAVEALRALGAEPSWRLPDRVEGYGLSVATIERLADEGAGLLVTTDCGITAAREVAAARSRGLDVVITDHHRPGAVLPDCPIVHPALGGYPFEGLCAAAVAHKLSARLRELAGLDPAGAEAELDLVALATVCDLVPLVDENRRLVREGLRALARTRRPGLRALMRIAALETSEIDERAVGFRLGPRLNAAGRMRRADAALELLMTSDEGRAAEVADELDLLNRERRDVEVRILFAAEAVRSEQAESSAYVLAGEGWHPGVVGIVASRLCDRHCRPCVVIGIGPDGARGSGRSIPAFDLHAALAACAPHLRRFGGHRAAAGLELDPERIGAFRRDFAAHAAANLAPEDLIPVEDVDAVVPGTALGLPLAEELRTLAPFGHGNREPTLLVPAARAGDVRPMGDEGQHARFTLASGGGRAQGVAFRTSPSALARDGGEPCDALVRLELREWNGAVEPRVVLTAICAAELGECGELGAEEEPWDDLDGTTVAVRATRPVDRLVRDRRREGVAGVCGEILSSGEPAALVCADVGRRRRALEQLVAGLARADGHHRSPALLAWETLERHPAAAELTHVIAVDPPLAAGALERIEGPVPGYLHLAWGQPEVEFARAVARATLDLRPALTQLYRALRSAGEVEGEALRSLLAGAGPHPRSPALMRRLVSVLRELGLAEFELEGPCAPRCRALEVEQTALERSSTYVASLRALEQAERYLAAEAAALARPPEARAETA